ncbi:hypothetical protein DMA11_00660 [Marinilabiliaceae bacterium JC017]|nr:hypothetical protein DMA11_00660 [Marinilabiliaceae bacterium JC017]
MPVKHYPVLRFRSAYPEFFTAGFPFQYRITLTTEVLVMGIPISTVMAEQKVGNALKTGAEHIVSTEAS